MGQWGDSNTDLQRPMTFQKKCCGMWFYNIVIISYIPSDWNFCSTSQTELIVHVEDLSLKTEGLTN